MVDPISALGLATGIIGLVPICADGFTFIEGICKAQGGLGNQVIRIRGQKAILRGKAGVRLGTFHWNTLNMKQLLDGRVNRTIGKQDVQVIRNHMNIVMRCHFKLRGEQQFGELVERLKEFVENLLKMCSEVQAQVNRKPLERAKSLNSGSQRIEKAILKQLSNSDNPDDLKSISRVYGQEVEDRKRAGQRYQGYELIKEVVDFKARVQHLARKRVEETAKRIVSRRSNAFLLSTRFLDVNDFRYKTPVWKPRSSTLTLATVKKLNALRYVEWKSYAEENGRENSDYESHILELADFLGVPNRPSAFQVLPCLGIFRDEARSRFGFAFEPPSYIRNLNLKPKRGSGIDGGLSSRTPVTLLDLIQQQTTMDGRPGIIPLGDRFHIARKLAQTLYVMHAMGWVHKNVRSSSVIFVPAESSYGGIPSMSGAKDLTNPYLGGFGFSRPKAPPEGEKRMKSAAVSYITLDPYQHPSKRQKPQQHYIQAFDLYSLGAVLLEIGLWQSIESFELDDDYKDVSRFSERLTRLAKRELPGEMGNIYAEAVRECLTSSEDDSDSYTQDRLCWKVNAALDQCVA